ncbi:hypothetical protein [Brevibacillus brevis]|nr:hypothetical protein [Brevibacillus brevis]WJQ83763.1 hypothetical protein QN310_11780 [Brevibacillus brevis]
MDFGLTPDIYNRIADIKKRMYANQVIPTDEVTTLIGDIGYEMEWYNLKD